MATQRFNSSRPYGEIKPPTNGAFYEQDGAYFSHTGDFLGTDFSALGSRGAAKSAPAKPAKQAVAVEETADEGENSGEEELNLAGWARGEEKYAFFSVRAEILNRFPDANVTNAKSAKVALVDAGVIEHDDVRW